MDHVLLIWKDTRERKTLFKTSKNGKMLQYTDNNILFIEEDGEVLKVENMR
jgi:hypothetical protein